MPNADFFSQLGLFVRKSFIDAETCARIQAEVRAGAPVPRKIIRHGVEMLDEDFRKSSTVAVSAATRAYIEERLLAVRPDLERCFGTTLPTHEPPYFGAYREGDFFMPHTDGSDNPDSLEIIKARHVTAVIFLNGQTDDPGDASYCGGSLVLYGLIDDPAWTQFGFPVASEPGTLIAFRANVIHEVEPITAGVRCTVVCRFCRAVDHPPA
jgi:SM-20-related protein